MNKDDNPKHWKLGIFYYNKDNPSEFVDKRKGIGTTLNFASKHGRHMFAIMLIPAVIMIMLCIIIVFLSSK
ncbi:MAG: hypothetical protein GYA16_05565 [Spirochaetes bacterium]|nr:hypothetical protein [Spirochaetota bacterium]